MRHVNMRTAWLSLTALVFLSACGTASLPGIFTTGDIRVLGLEPDVRDCVVYEGMWMAILGENLGSEEAWEAGDNVAVFPPNPPGILADQVDLVGNSLFILVPDGAESGTLILDAGDAGSAEIPITIETFGAGGVEPQLVAPTCSSNPPPA